MSIDPMTTLGQLVAARLGRSRVFEQLGLDYCCGGKTTLDAACERKGLDVATVVETLRASDEEATAEDHTDYESMPLGALADHIEGSHHATLRRELPRLEALLQKVIAAHGSRHPELLTVREVFRVLRSELESHLLKEERILFPIIRQLDAAAVRPEFHCGSVNNPIRVMEDEHDAAGTALERLRSLTWHYTAPSDGCVSFRALYQGLAELEQDLHQHIHKENNILFPRAIELESAYPVG